MNKFPPIAVLGAGAWGTALAMLLARNGQPVRLWDVDTKRLSQLQSERAFAGVAFSNQLKIETNLENAVRDVTDVCLVIPSFAFRDVLMQLKIIMPSTVRFVWGTKGLDPENQGFLHQTIYTIFSDKIPVAALSGPSFAKEVAMDMPTAVSLAGNNPEFLASLVKRFHNNHFRVYINPDLIGIQLCGVVKNVMAIAVGISDGLGLGTNTKCALITRGLAEMGRLCEKLGGKRETTMSLAGVGDLVLTCTDNQSRNRRFGLAVGKGLSASAALKEIGESVEGYYNAKQLFQLAKRNNVLMPISEQVYAILYENVSADHVLKELLARESAVE